MANVLHELLGLLQAAAGEPTGSRHSHLGKWRERASALIAQAIDGGGPGPSGQLPFVQAQYSEGGGQTVVNGSDIVFDESNVGTIPYNPATGVFTLAANSRYELEAYFTLGNYSGETVNVVIEWVDAVTELPLHQRHGAFLTPVDNTTSINPQPTAATFHETGGAPQTVKLMVTGTAGSADVLNTYSYAMVKEI